MQQHSNQMREEFPSREQAEAFRATRSLTEPGSKWVLFETEEGRWAVARSDGQSTGPTGTSIAEKPKPDSEDPRQAMSRNIPPFGA